MKHHRPNPSDIFLSRRQLLQRCGMGMGTLALGSILAESARAASVNPLVVKPSQFPGKAKRVIHLFMNGGPSQVDTFDPKPTLEKWAGKELPMEKLRTERKTGAALPSFYKFKKYGES